MMNNKKITEFFMLIMLLSGMCFENIRADFCFGYGENEQTMTAFTKETHNYTNDVAYNEDVMGMKPHLNFKRGIRRLHYRNYGGKRSFFTFHSVAEEPSAVNLSRKQLSPCVKTYGYEYTVKKYIYDKDGKKRC